MLAGLLALTVAAVFSGAAIYVFAVEHVARAVLDDRAQLAEWKPSYKRGALMQASLSPLGTIAGAVAWWQTGDACFLAGALAPVFPAKPSTPVGRITRHVAHAPAAKHPWET